MTYLEMKKEVKRAFLKKLAESKEKGEKAVVHTTAWCEFCMSDNKKRWEVKLVEQSGIKHINDPFLIGTLEKTQFILACSPCIDKYNLTPLKNSVGAKWDGENEIIEEIYGTK